MTANAYPRRQNGLSMLELLVALIIFSLGIMGIASLHANGLKYSHTAENRSQASLLSSDIIDRARANLPNLQDYELSLGKLPNGNKRHVIAQTDLEEWYERVSTYLPGGQGEVTIKDKRLSVRIVWNDRDPAEPNGFRQAQLSMSADIR